MDVFTKLVMCFADDRESYYNGSNTAFNCELTKGVLWNADMHRPCSDIKVKVRSPYKTSEEQRLCVIPVDLKHCVVSTYIACAFFFLGFPSSRSSVHPNSFRQQSWWNQQVHQRLQHVSTCYRVVLLIAFELLLAATKSTCCIRCTNRSYVRAGAFEVFLPLLGAYWHNFPLREKE